jgi:hypothetical protein
MGLKAISWVLHFPLSDGDGMLIEVLVISERPRHEVQPTHRVDDGGADGTVCDDY